MESKRNYSSIKKIQTLASIKCSEDRSTYLKKIGFKPIDDEEETYMYSFPVLFYGKIPTLFCRLLVYEDSNKVQIDVLNPDGTAYAPFYYVEYGNYVSILNDINKNISKKLKKLGIEEPKKKRGKTNEKQKIACCLSK